MKRWLVLAIALAACSRSAEMVEADDLKSTLDRLRASDREDVGRRRALLDELVKKPATLAEARKAREACVEAYGLLVDQQEIMARALPKLKSKVELSDAELAEVKAEIAGAERKLDAAKSAVSACNAACFELTIALSR